LKFVLSTNLMTSADIYPSTDQFAAAIC